MSSIMRCRNGETRDVASMALLLLRSEAACLVAQHKQIDDPAQPHRWNEARFLPREYEGTSHFPVTVSTHQD
jgi:hypothetical protein